MILPRHLKAATRVALLSCVLLLVWASAAWAAGAGERPRCTPSIEVNAHEVGAGETVTVFGTLACAEGEELAGEPVTLYARTPGSGEMQPVAETTAAADGAYRLTSPAIDQTTVFAVGAARPRSVRIRVVVVAHVSFGTGAAGSSPALPDAATSLRSRAAVTFSGAVTPAGAQMLAVLQRERPTGSGEWRRIAVAAVAPDGSYSIIHRFGRPGVAVLRVVVRRRGLPVAKSEPSSFQILPRGRARPGIEPAAVGS